MRSLFQAIGFMFLLLCTILGIGDTTESLYASELCWVPCGRLLKAPYSSSVNAAFSSVLHRNTSTPSPKMGPSPLPSPPPARVAHSKHRERRLWHKKHHLPLNKKNKRHRHSLASSATKPGASLNKEKDAFRLIQNSLARIPAAHSSIQNTASSSDIPISSMQPSVKEWNQLPLLKTSFFKLMASLHQDAKKEKSSFSHQLFGLFLQLPLSLSCGVLSALFYALGHRKKSPFHVFS